MGRVCEIVLRLAGHFKLFVGHLIGFNYCSLPDIFKFYWTSQASPANFAYSAYNMGWHCMITSFMCYRIDLTYK